MNSRRVFPFRMQPWHLAALIIAACTGVIVGIYALRSRGIESPAELMACLPRNRATLAYVDVDALRRSGFLDLIAGSKAAEDLEYKTFVDGTGFDYRGDLDRLALAIVQNDVWLVLRGRFNWNKLHSYTTSHGGQCTNAVCSVQMSPKRWVSYYPLRAGAMALSISAQVGAVYAISPNTNTGPVDAVPEQPVWISVPAAALRNAPSLPAGAKSFVSPLGSAEKIVFRLGPDANNLRLWADVTCSSEAAASDLMLQLQNATVMLQKMLARENQQPNPRDLSGLLAAGSFSRDGRRVLGAWPVPREFVETIAAGDLN